jgi:hypothetical protein
VRILANAAPAVEEVLLPKARFALVAELVVLAASEVTARLGNPTAQLPRVGQVSFQVPVVLEVPEAGRKLKHGGFQMPRRGKEPRGGTKVLSARSPNYASGLALSLARRLTRGRGRRRWWDRK